MMPEVKVGLALVGPDTPPLPPSPEPRNPQVKLDNGWWIVKLDSEYPKKFQKFQVYFSVDLIYIIIIIFSIETRLKDHLKGSSA